MQADCHAGHAEEAAPLRDQQMHIIRGEAAQKVELEDREAA